MRWLGVVQDQVDPAGHDCRLSLRNRLAAPQRWWIGFALLMACGVAARAGHETVTPHTGQVAQQRHLATRHPRRQRQHADSIMNTERPRTLPPSAKFNTKTTPRRSPESRPPARRQDPQSGSDNGAKAHRAPARTPEFRPQAVEPALSSSEQLSVSPTRPEAESRAVPDPFRTSTATASPVLRGMVTAAPVNREHFKAPDQALRLPLISVPEASVPLPQERDINPLGFIRDSISVLDSNAGSPHAATLPPSASQARPSQPPTQQPPTQQPPTQQPLTLQSPRTQPPPSHHEPPPLVVRQPEIQPRGNRVIPSESSEAEAIDRGSAESSSPKFEIQLLPPTANLGRDLHSKLAAPATRDDLVQPSFTAAALNDRSESQGPTEIIAVRFETMNASPAPLQPTQTDTSASAEGQDPLDGHRPDLALHFESTDQGRLDNPGPSPGLVNRDSHGPQTPTSDYSPIVTLVQGTGLAALGLEPERAVAGLRIAQTSDDTSSPHATFRSAPIGDAASNIAPPPGEFPANLAANLFSAESDADARRRRSEYEKVVLWDASAVGYKALLFEEPNLERHGHRVPVVQPVLSAAHFFATVPALPYLAVSERARQCRYPLGYDRPGNCAPLTWYLPQLRVDASAAEALTLTGLILALP